MGSELRSVGLYGNASEQEVFWRNFFAAGSGWRNANQHTPKSNETAGIRSIRVQRNTEGEIKRVRVLFGPHHFMLGQTHHGFRASASSVGGELQEIINTIRGRFVKNVIDTVKPCKGEQV